MWRATVRFHRGLFRSPWPVRLWLLVLVAANLVAPLLLWPAREAQLTLLAMAAAMAIMIGLTAATGFSRLLGVGHFV